MDRPEWVAVHPFRRRGIRNVHQQHLANRPDAANPRCPNPLGHILRWQNTEGDHGAETFVWSVFALAGAGLGTGDGSTIAPGDAFGSPDGLAFDEKGWVWIETEGRQPVPCNNQMLSADPVTGDIRRFLVGPKGCEITGWSDDGRQPNTVRQHPAPRRVRHARQPGVAVELARLPGRPRSATLAIRRVDGGRVA